MNYKTEDERAEKDRLLRRRESLGLEKRKNELELTEIKNKIRGRRLAPKQYTAYCNGQQKRLQRILSIEEELKLIKSRLRELDEIETKRIVSERAAKVENENSGETARAEILNEKYLELLLYVSEIRDEYRRFSADATRISSMRRSAAEFANRLDEVINLFQSE